MSSQPVRLAAASAVRDRLVQIGILMLGCLSQQILQESLVQAGSFTLAGWTVLACPPIPHIYVQQVKPLYVRQSNLQSNILTHVWNSCHKLWLCFL
jgi:hypothetical protein